MPIHPPGHRDRHNRLRSTGKRNVVAILSLTAMVDMFTVLTIFLLQNYKSTDQILFIPKEVELPKAEQIRELSPAHVVTISAKELLLDQDQVANATEVREQRNWMIVPLYQRLLSSFRKAQQEEERIARKLQRAMTDRQASRGKSRKVTIQADRDIDFLTVKKVMYTVTEAGAEEINFAVNPKKEAVN